MHNTRLRRACLITLSTLCCVFLSTAANSQQTRQIVGEPSKGEPAVRENVADIMARQALLDTQGRRIKPPPVRKEFEKFRTPKRPNSRSPKVSRWPLSPRVAAAVTLPFNPQSIGANFVGVDFADAPPAIPPDSMGDVGPTQILVATNGRIRAFNKNGIPNGLDAELDVFFGSLLTSTVTSAQFASDPHVRFDRLSNRWFVTAISVSTLDNQPPNNILIAVSSGPTINSSASFSFFKFRHDAVGAVPNPDAGGFADYDTLGVDRFALYIGVNVLKLTGTTLTIGTTAFVVRKADLLAGILTVTPFRQLGTFTANTSTGNFSGSGMDTPQGVHNDDPSATQGYFIGVDMTSFGVLNLRRITNPGGTPSISSSDIQIVLPTTAFPVDQVQPGGIPLDALTDRLYAAGIFKNKITGVSSLWTAHTIQVDSGGVGNPAGGRNGSRWYEVTNLTGTPTLNQAGTLFDSAASNPFGYWFPSVALSGQGHMVIGASRASSVDPEGRAGVVVAGRLAGDPPTTTQSPTLVQPGLATYNAQPGETVQRWGDYSQTVVDPLDDMTMWTFQEFANAQGRWSVQVTRLNAPPPPPIMSANPALVPPGQSSVNVTISGSSGGGEGFFDPGPDVGGPGFANRLLASVNNGVAVNSTTFNSPTSLTVNVSTVGTPLGSKSVTVTNPDLQSSFGANVLTIALLPTTTTVTSSSNPSFVGQSVTFTATVGSSSSFPAPTGTVTFKNGAAILGTAPLVGGNASFSASFSSAGSRSITAEYGGDSAHAISTSPILSQTVLFATSTSLVSGQNPSLVGNAVTFTATVSNAPAGGSTPTGTMTFRDGTTTLGTSTLNASGQATLTPTLSQARSYFVTASYSGDATHNPSNSPTLHQLVQAPGVGLSMTSSPDPVMIGQLVTLTTTVTNTGAGAAAYNLTQSFAGSFIFVSASPSQGNCTGTGPVTCTLNTLNPSSSATIVAVVRVLFGRTLGVTSTVTSPASGSIAENVRVRFRPFKF